MPSPSRLALPALAALAASLAAAPAVLGQEGDPETPDAWRAPPLETPTRTRTRYAVTTGADYQLSGDYFNAFRGRAALRMTHEVTEALDLNLGFSYNFDHYDFDAADSDIGDPWSDVHTLRLSSLVSVELTSTWTAFGGGFLELAREHTPDIDDSIVGGAFGGVTHRLGNDLLVGLGLGVADQLQDGVRIFPVFVVEWEISPDLRLSTRSAGDATGRAGAELIYALDRDTDLAFGGGYRYKRFRLDGSGPAPGGVGEETAFPIWLRLTHEIDANVAFTVQAGILLGGEITLEQDNGQHDTESYDPSGTIGISARFRF